MCRSASSGIVLVSLFIKNFRGEVPWPLDVSGFLLSGSGLACLIFGLTVAGRGVFGKQLIFALLGVGTILLAAYWLHARRAKFPILDLRLLTLPTFRASIVGGSLFRIGDRRHAVSAAA